MIDSCCCSRLTVKSSLPCLAFGCVPVQPPAWPLMMRPRTAHSNLWSHVKSVKPHGPPTEGSLQQYCCCATFPGRCGQALAPLVPATVHSSAHLAAAAVRGGLALLVQLGAPSAILTVAGQDH